MRTPPITYKSGATSTAPTAPLASGDGGTTNSALRAYKMPPARGDRAPFPRAPGTIIAVASQLPQDEGRTVTRWTFDEIVATLLGDMETDAISRSPIWRTLQEIELKPHKSE